MRTFAVGDVHGHLRQLQDLLRLIDAAAKGEPRRLVFLGDYIDRGPDSAGVIETLRAIQRSEPEGHVVCLKGNHEDMLLGSRRDPLSDLVWLDNGGAECLASYGVSSSDGLPEEHVDWIEACPTYFEDDWRCYVHAGLDPARARRDQKDSDRLWIREAFLSVEHDFGRFVVHGHTPQKTGRPDLRPHRVNLDTAAAYGGPLTSAMFVDGRERPVSFLQAMP